MRKSRNRFSFANKKLSLNVYQTHIRFPKSCDGFISAFTYKCFYNFRNKSLRRQLFQFSSKKILYLFLQQKSKDGAILCLETTTLFAWLIFGVKSWPAYATLRISHWRPPRFVSVNCTMSSTNLRLFIASEFRLLKPTAFSSNNISSNILSASKWNSDNYISRNLSKSAVILKVISKRI